MADWKAGDLALCITVAPFDRGGDLVCVRRGGVYRVSALGMVDSLDVLQLDGVDSENDTESGWLGAYRFRKITPGADIEGFEEPRRIPVKEKA